MWLKLLIPPIAKRQRLDDDAVNEDGMLRNINVQKLEGASLNDNERKRRDLEHFFGPPELRTGKTNKQKNHCQCKKCK